MERLETDVAVIGAGTAGLTARREAERAGARTVLIESGPYGTTCARVGCMPSKLLIAAAEAAHEIVRADLFGIRVAPPTVDGRAVLERVRRERDRFVGFVVEDTEALPEETRLRGAARFVAPGVLEVGGHTRVEAKAVVVATGSTAVVPDSVSSLGDRVVTTDTVFELEDLPGSVAVLGTGIIGLELGQALHRLGVRVRLFARRDVVGPLSDPVVLEAARTIFRGELDVHVVGELSAAREGDRVRLRWIEAGGRAREDDVDLVLAAAGRRPNLAGLSLENAGLALGDGGAPEIDPRTGQCGDAPVFFAGDVSGSLAVLHEAADEGRIAGYNAARFPDLRAHGRRTPLAIVFSDPQIAVVGTPWHELDPDRTAVGSVDYGDQGRARVMAKNAGVVRVYADGSHGRLVGAEMVGPRVEHTAHLLAWAVQQGLTIPEILELPFYHPVVEEGIRTALRDAGQKLRFTRKPCAHELDCGPGA